MVDHRFYTSVQKDSVKYGLGAPVCGNFLYATWDESVTDNLKDLKQPFPGYFYRGLDEAGILDQVLTDIHEH